MLPGKLCKPPHPHGPQHGWQGQACLGTPLHQRRPSATQAACAQSTYLRQVALTAILAHIGCLVPASFAHVPLLDGVFTRMGMADSIEHNSSSFMMEMQLLDRLVC